ncbi:hypothetical protein ABZ923_32120 [Streptomyces sp. NPDC046881]|uniref:hypothetical protein n=1 Tax=Streptomyces sp. NPDC046881 TaxID=3155374 RepID=UPI0033DA379D
MTDTRGNHAEAGIIVYVNGKKRYPLWTMEDYAHSVRDAEYGGVYNLPEGARIGVSMWGGATVDKTIDHSWVNDH